MTDDLPNELRPANPEVPKPLDYFGNKMDSEIEKIHPGWTRNNLREVRPNIISIGDGEGLELRSLAKKYNAHVWGIDINPPAINQSMQRIGQTGEVTQLIGDATLPDSYAPNVTYSLVIFRSPNPTSSDTDSVWYKSVTRASERMSPDGVIYCTLNSVGENDHMKAILEAQGFEVQQSNDQKPDYAKKAGPFPENFILIAKKKV